MKTERLVLPLFLLLVACGAAAAQDRGSGLAASEDFAWQLSPDMHLIAAAPSDANGSARGPSAAPAGGSAILFPTLVGKAAARKPDGFSRFTRLAGMFMGRVPALAVGNMRICFKLDLR